MLGCLLVGAAGIFSAQAQAPQLINYQGRLLQGTNLVNGNVGLSLRLFNVSSGGSRLYEDSNTVTVVDGLYSTFIGDNTTYGDFFGTLYQNQLWIEVAVNGVALTPRERLASVAYAQRVRGLEIRTNGFPSAIIVPQWNGIDLEAGGSVVAGGVGNYVENADYSFIGSGYQNLIGSNANYAVLGGGQLNVINTNSSGAVLGGGFLNQIGSNSLSSVIAGGYQNEIRHNSEYSVVSGGSGNQVRERSPNGVVAGGENNIILQGVTNGFIGGGANNVIGFGASYASIPGGFENRAGGSGSFAAGNRAYATNDGTFVWSDDSSTSPFQSTSTNQFLVRAKGGVGINTNRPGAALHVAGEAMIGSVANPARFGMASVRLNSTGNLFVHPADTNLIMTWDSAARVLSITNTSLNYYDCQMQFIAENSTAPAVGSQDLSALTINSIRLTNSAGLNAGWSATATRENTSGACFQFNGTGFDSVISGLVIYWY